jgi:Mg-chelatase subunit ChlD
MKENYAHITVILDRSGSMEGIREDTIGGFNSFLREQKAQPGQATLTLVQFDTQDPYEVIQHFRPIGDVPDLSTDTYTPRGGTPLLDALGKGIHDMDESVKKLEDDQRPDRVIMVVVTDGQENSSREYKKSDIEKLVKEKSEKAGWQFVFLSADLAAMEEARDLGIPADSSLYYARSRKGSSSSWGAASGHLSNYRRAMSKKIGFNPADRKEADDTSK